MRWVHIVIIFSLVRLIHRPSVFETTIRYLGGLLSAYELSNQQFPVLLQKAKEVGDKLAFAWVGVSCRFDKMLRSRC